MNIQTNKKPITALYKEERLKFIRVELDKGVFVSTASICEKFNVSDQTARKDLSELAKQGPYKKVRGGAILKHSDLKRYLNLRDRFYNISAEIVLELKTKHEELFRNTDSILLLGDSTLFREIVANLNDLFDKDTTIYTNSIIVASQLTEKERNKAILLPGQIDAQKDVTKGQETLEFFNYLHRISTLIIIPNYFEEQQRSALVGFETEQEGSLAKALIKKNNPKNIVFFADPDVLKEKKSFCQLEMSRNEVGCLVQALWQDEKSSFRIPEIAKKVIRVSVARKSKKVAVLKNKASLKGA